MVSALAGGLLRFFVQGSNLPQELIVLVLGQQHPGRNRETVRLLYRLTISLAALRSGTPFKHKAQQHHWNRECPEVSPEVVSESKGEIDEENSLASRPHEFSSNS